MWRGLGRYRILGETLDDAAGEAFDKTAKMLGLPYPGGAALAQLAESGRRGRFDFPRPMLDRPGLDFSFSGLKTAALVALRGRALGRPDPSGCRARFPGSGGRHARGEVAAGAAGDRPSASGGCRRRGRESAPARAAAADDRARCRSATVLSARGVLHRQRRDDRAGRLSAAGGRSAAGLGSSPPGRIGSWGTSR